jgi:hypothetical protein
MVFHLAIVAMCFIGNAVEKAVSKNWLGAIGDTFIGSMSVYYAVKAHGNGWD